ncbi:MAG: isocitrate/isopropylmalate dehydrogenase family protein [Candidatus Odinarchaeum yellowstonii]|uniref:Isocitrate/isopropylmalate dehydrogenase family protein n=1 Tax=Odinarchaeota yellowstonii (strain LCB_4) TaxID=1841599 RepID=A0AAF0D2E6_ODILC|nr:MAG: isocitrate/isopropylmalate dehydrogenase family protein [Candidatus Odinarchaeum yellowstonii]
MVKVTLIPGDGIGPEITEAMLNCVEATGADIQWDRVSAGAVALEKYGTPLPEETVNSFKKTHVLLKGPITTSFGSGFRSVTVALRQAFDLYANVRPAKSVEGVDSRFKNVDLIIIRENTEGSYFGIEFQKSSPELKELIQLLKKTHNIMLEEDAAITLKKISVRASQRIVKFAFDYAVENNRKKVTCVHKANIHKFSDGLFIEEARKIAQSYPDIIYEEKVVDNMAMQLVMKPEEYDVIVTPNLYGDILSDLAAGLVGGLGLLAGANIGAEYAMFEPVHGSAPKYAGLNKVNPTAMINSAIMMLRHLKMFSEAELLEKATLKVIKEGVKVTYDLYNRPSGSPVGTMEMADEIVRQIELLKSKGE